MSGCLPAVRLLCSRKRFCVSTPGVRVQIRQDNEIYSSYQRRIRAAQEQTMCLRCINLSLSSLIYNR